MRPGFDARRRNRNIGTARQGHGSDNALVIPKSWHQDRVFYERLEDPKIVTRHLHGRELTFLVEPTRSDCVHACTVDDIVEALGLLPPEHRLEVKTFVLRQPKRKEEILRSVWGRIVYWPNLGRYRDVAIYLDAQNPDRVLRWPLSLDPPDMRDLERLREHGHGIERTPREFRITCSLESIRCTQLYNTLFHEVGHYVLYRRDLADGKDYRQRTHRESEVFAHRYADELRAREQLAKDGLLPRWFGI